MKGERATMAAENTTFYNPVFPGWHTDPTCTFVPELDNTHFCAFSSFLTFPGIPIYASKDLINWKLVSHALIRETQLPELLTDGSIQHQGIWAPTLRYHEGRLYIISPYILFNTWFQQIFVVSTADPFDTDSWTDPIWMDNPTNSIDPDFFMDKGTLYVSMSAGDRIVQSRFNMATGETSEPIRLWSGTGGRNPEGPHIYKKDGWYYLLVSEGGTETNHTVTIARGKDPEGPFEGYENNPVLTNKNTDEYIQCVGHADFFQDFEGNWWGVALACRSGPEWQIYPMGRESHLYPMTWDEGEWPVLAPVRGRMSGPLPPKNLDVAGEGPWLSDGDEYDFAPGSSIPKNLIHWRIQQNRTERFTVSPEGHANMLRLTPTKYSLDSAVPPELIGDPNAGIHPLTFIARKQSHTIFNFSVDLNFHPGEENEEAGVTLFLTQFQHVELGYVRLKAPDGRLAMYLRFKHELSGKEGYEGEPLASEPEPALHKVPCAWLGHPVRLQISAVNETHYVFNAASVGSDGKESDKVVLGIVSAWFMSGGSGQFMVGAYATSNGGDNLTPAYVSRWRYEPIAQRISDDEFVPADEHPVPGRA
ncbi:xylosidase/arabinosidase [Verticillium dahliae]|nr:xylosidase/arabinosidase [Verticillium dahliae]